MRFTTKPFRKRASPLANPSPPESRHRYFTLVKYDGATSSRAFQTRQLNGRRNLTLIDDTSVVSACTILNQGSRQILISFWDSLPTGQHFSWSTGPLKSYPLAGRSVLLPSIVLTKGMGVPKDSDPNLKEYGMTGGLDLPATQALNNAIPATDEDAKDTSISYYQGKGFRFN